MVPRVRTEAQLRGGLVGALSGAMGIAGHGLGAGHPSAMAQLMPAMGSATPSPGSLLMLLGLCAGLGALVAAGPVRGRAGLLAALVSGQVGGHLVLGLTTASHSLSPTGSMVAAHLAATVVCAVVIGAVERAWRVVRTTVEAILAVVAGPPRRHARAAAPPGSSSFPAPGSWFGCPTRLRGPPEWCLAALSD